MTQENEIEDQKEPAFPIVHAIVGIPGHYTKLPPDIPGWSRLEDACIRLKVPHSGKKWLDDLIRESLRDELAGKAMDGMINSNSNPNSVGYSLDSNPSIPALSYEYADALLAQKAEENNDSRRATYCDCRGLRHLQMPWMWMGYPGMLGA